MARIGYNEFLTEIGKTAVAGAPSRWTTLTVDVIGLAERVTVDAYASTPEAKGEVEWPTSGSIAAFKLREAMCQPNTGTWYRATFTIDDDGQLRTDFDYYSGPFELDETDTVDIVKLLERDHELYPRDEEHLPAWHPAKMA